MITTSSPLLTYHSSLDPWHWSQPLSFSNQSKQGHRQLARYLLVFADQDSEEQQRVPAEKSWTHDGLDQRRHERKGIRRITLLFFNKIIVVFKGFKSIRLLFREAYVLPCSSHHVSKSWEMSEEEEEKGRREGEWTQRCKGSSFLLEKKKVDFSLSRFCWIGFPRDMESHASCEAWLFYTGTFLFIQSTRSCLKFVHVLTGICLVVWLWLLFK